MQKDSFASDEAKESFLCEWIVSVFCIGKMGG